MCSKADSLGVPELRLDPEEPSSRVSGFNYDAILSGREE